MTRQWLLIQFFFVLQEEGSDMSPVKEAWEVLLPEESQADEQSARCFILDRMNEDDAYDFSTDYV